MKIPSAKEKDFVLNLYYNRDVKGIAPPREEDCPHNFREIEVILNDDGYIVSNYGYLVTSSLMSLYIYLSIGISVFRVTPYIIYTLPLILSEQV